MLTTAAWAIALLSLLQFEVNALGPLRVAHALLPNLAAAAAATAHSSSSDGPGGTAAGRPGVPASGPPKVALISSKMGSIQLTKQGGKNGSVGYR